MGILDLNADKGRGWPPKEDGARVFLSIPFYQEIIGQAADTYDHGCAPGSKNSYAKVYSAGSFLARNFNAVWCEALNTRRDRGWTDFAMIHADVTPHGIGWLDKLIEERKACGADLLSVVLPIKTSHGLTSTAIKNTITGDIRRLTMHEVTRIPSATFDGQTAANALNIEGEWDLLPSTGLWVCDFTAPWVQEVWFDVRDRILRRPDGEFYYETATDDWLFAMKLHKLNLKLCSTKILPCGHWGLIEFRNDCAWGSMQEDPMVGSFSWLDDK